MSASPSGALAAHHCQGLVAEAHRCHRPSSSALAPRLRRTRPGTSPPSAGTQMRSHDAYTSAGAPPAAPARALGVGVLRHEAHFEVRGSHMAGSAGRYQYHSFFAQTKHAMQY